MTRIVLDASVVVTCLFKDGSARRVLLHASKITFLALPGIQEDARAQLSRVARRTGLPPETVRLFLEDLLRDVEVVPMNRLRSVETKARRAARDAGDENDWEYVALSWVEDAPIWTYDADFSRMDGVRTISTAEVSGQS